jgi:hypothetical protein
MKNFFALLAALLFLAFSIPSDAAGSHRVRGYWRDTDHDGVKDTYVQPYQRTNPDSSPYNNYGYPGNYNPNRGETTPGDSDKYLERHQERKGW